MACLCERAPTDDKPETGLKDTGEGLNGWVKSVLWATQGPKRHLLSCRFLFEKSAMSNDHATPIEQPGLNSLSKSFEPAALEAHWGPEWEKRGYGVAGFRGTGAPASDAPAFAIQLPPPNVTGTLHMGHAFNQTIMDSLTRYHRMMGTTPLGFPAPTTPALPPRSWWNANCRPKASAATTWAPHPPKRARTL